MREVEVLLALIFKQSESHDLQKLHKLLVAALQDNRFRLQLVILNFLVLKLNGLLRDFDVIAQGSIELALVRQRGTEGQAESLTVRVHVQVAHRHLIDMSLL